MVKVTSSITFLSFERVYLLSMHAKYEVSFFFGPKVMAKDKVFATVTHTHTQTDIQTGLDASEFHSGA